MLTVPRRGGSDQYERFETQTLKFILQTKQLEVRWESCCTALLPSVKLPSKATGGRNTGTVVNRPTSGGHETLFDRLKSETQRGSALFQVGRTSSFLICFADQWKICRLNKFCHLCWCVKISSAPIWISDEHLMNKMDQTLLDWILRRPSGLFAAETPCDARSVHCPGYKSVRRSSSPLVFTPRRLSARPSRCNLTEEGSAGSSSDWGHSAQPLGRY